MANVTFSRGATLVTIAPPRFPDEPGRTYPQVVGETAGGGIFVADLGDGSTTQSARTLRFRRLSPAHFAALQSFVEQTAHWSYYAITYVDPVGITYTGVRYLGGLEGAQLNRGGSSGLYDVDLLLKQDLTV